MLKSLPGLTVYDSLKQLLLALEGYVVKQKIMLPVNLKIYKISFNVLNFKTILICTAKGKNLFKNQAVRGARNIMEYMIAGHEFKTRRTGRRSAW